MNRVGKLGPVNTNEDITVKTKITAIKARGAWFGYSKRATSNAEWGGFGLYPVGRGHFVALLCYHLLI